MRRTLALSIAAALTAAALPGALPAPASSGPRRPLRCRTIERDGRNFRLCRGLVPTADGAARLDADVTLPPRGAGPFPLVVMLHGLGGTKTSYESDTIEGSDAAYHFNNLWFASRGYAVLNYTARGFGAGECADPSIESFDGGPAYGSSPACMPQLDHRAYEIADTQRLVGRLVDGTLLDAAGVTVAPRRVAVAGASYGGGHAWTLTRRNTWRSPQGARVVVAVAVPIAGWTDLADALVPNGRARDDAAPPTLAQRLAEPFGVAKASYVAHLYDAMAGAATDGLPGYLSAWVARLGAGEPYGDAVSADALRSLLEARSALYTPMARPHFHTAIFAVQGFTDGLFPAIEALRAYRDLRAGHADYPIGLYLGDWGHPPAQNKADEIAYVARSVNRWIDHYARDGRAPRVGVEARTNECDAAAMGELYRAAAWSDLSDAGVTYDFAGPATLATPADDPHAPALDPVRTGAPRDVCRTTDTAVDPDNAAFHTDVPAGMMIMGLPEVSLTADPDADDAYVAARLWDVDPVAGDRTLVTRGAVRLDGTAAQAVTFQLFGNAYDVAPGHRLVLELTADDGPAFRTWDPSGGASPDAATIEVANVSLTVPTADPDARVPRTAVRPAATAVSPGR